MAAFWQLHPWLIIILAVLAVPLVQALLDPWRRFLVYRERRAAIEALKVYAAQGRDPPAEVLAAANATTMVGSQDAAGPALAVMLAGVLWLNRPPAEPGLERR
jgi:hypothetical protein